MDKDSIGDDKSKLSKLQLSSDSTLNKTKANNPSISQLPDQSDQLEVLNELFELNLKLEKINEKYKINGDEPSKIIDDKLDKIKLNYIDLNPESINILFILSTKTKH